MQLRRINFIFSFVGSEHSAVELRSPAIHVGQRSCAKLENHEVKLIRRSGGGAGGRGQGRGRCSMRQRPEVERQGRGTGA
jgi:hypothetical protein